MRSKKIFNVVVGLKTKSYAGQRKLAGIFKFLADKYVWDITLLRSTEDLTLQFINQTKSKTDGYLLSLHESMEVRRAIVNLRKPIVFLDEIDLMSISGNKSACFLKTDQFAIGEVAAKHFLELSRFASFAFVNAIGNVHWSVERAEGFARALARRKIFPVVYDRDITSCNSSDLAQWISALPKPAAVFAAFDDRAVDVINACRACSVKIPRDVMILGAGNDELLCNSCRPALSSVNISFEQHGMMAARELQAKMMMQVKRGQTLNTPNDFAIIRRQTTTGKTEVNAIVHDGLAFISTFATSGIKVPDVVKHLKVSRRLADLRFQQATRKSILQTIIETKVNAAKKLLRSSTLSISDVAYHCGFSNANYFKNVFVRTVGMPPRTWRHNVSSP